jgi:hypothetical protein
LVDTGMGNKQLEKFYSLWGTHSWINLAKYGLSDEVTDVL